jgi:hypothetical protein
MKIFLRAALFLTLLPLFGSVLATGADELALLRARAEQGGAADQYRLGLVYADPAEPAYNPVEAYVWLRLAALHGATGAVLGPLTAGLTDAQLAAAQKVLASRGGPPAPAPRAPSLQTPFQSFSTPPHPTDTIPLNFELAATQREAEQAKIAFATQQVLLALREDNVKMLNTQIAGMTATLASRDRELAALKARSSSAAAADTAAEHATLRQQLTASQKELAATKLALTGNGRVPAATDDLSRQLAGAAGKPDVSSATNLVQVNAAQTVTATPAGATEKLDPALTPDNVQLASTRSDTPAAANATANQPLKTRR